MPVLLVAHLPPSPPAHDHWCAIDGDGRYLDGGKHLAGLGSALDAAFDAIWPQWQALAAALSTDGRAAWSHMVSCAPNASDFGTMLAWSHLVGLWASGQATILVVCPDPWLFRHLAEIAGVTAMSAPPSLWRTGLPLALRGLVARCRAALRFAKAAWARPSPADKGGAWLLTYAHPGSDGRSRDAYFGDLPAMLPDLSIALHVDSRPEEIRRLGVGGRCHALSAWGAPVFALAGWRCVWKPAIAQGMPAWLLRRAAAKEAGGAQAAAIRWQVHCQQRWLEAVRPQVVAWPWENHGWERALCRQAVAAGVKTVGWQHALVGRQELNYRPGPAGTLPDRILCGGMASLKQLRSFGHAADRLELAGSLRYVDFPPVIHDRRGSILLALPFNRQIAAEMVAAAGVLSQAGHTVLVRDHPMAGPTPPLPSGMSAGAPPLARHQALAAVIFSASTIGLEAVLAGIPALRFLSRVSVALDALPESAASLVITCDQDTLFEALEQCRPVAAVADEFFALSRPSLWQSHLDPYKT